MRLRISRAEIDCEICGHWPGDPVHLAFAKAASIHSQIKFRDKAKMGFHVRIYSERLVLRHQWRISRQVDAFKDNVFIEIERDGIVGLGEAAHNPRYDESLDSTLGFLQATRPVLEKCHPSHYRHVIDEID